MKSASLVLGGAICVGAWADEAAILSSFRQAAPHLPVAAVSESPMRGLYEIRVEGQSTVFHVSDDGQFLLAGDLYALRSGGLDNLTEANRETSRRRLLAGLAPDQMVVFAAAEPTRAVVTVFTDVDCVHCRRFHGDVGVLNAMGIEVRYLAYPGAGVGSVTYKNMESAWCAEDPQLAITELKRGGTVDEATCDAPLAEHMTLAKAVGVEGTPTLITTNGERLSGYIHPTELAERLGVAGSPVTAPP